MARWALMSIVATALCFIDSLSYRFGPLSLQIAKGVKGSSATWTSALQSTASMDSQERELNLRNRCERWAAKIAREDDPLLKRSILSRMYLSLKRVLNQVFNGLFWGFLMRVMNRVRIHNHKILLDAVFERDGTRPLITVQNHQSMIDDPALWTAVLPWWRLPPTMFRWGICTEDMFFAHPVLTYIMQHGNVLPIDRTGSLDQPSFEQLFLKLKRQKAWVHLFPEGKVNQSWRYLDGEPMLGVFKPGVGKLIAHLGTDSYPIILPIIHKNMDAVLPEIALKPGTKKRSKPISMVPKAGKKVEFYVGEPFDLKKEVEQFKQEHPQIHFDSFTTPNTDSLKFYQRLTDIVAQKMLQLEAEVREKCA